MVTKLARAALALLGALILTAPLAAEEREYAVGQIWSYKTAASDLRSLIKIQEIDQIGPKDDPVTVYHISMIGIAVSDASEPIEIGHLPVSRQTLDRSVTKLMEHPGPVVPLFPDYTEGKANWEEANGGVFTITLMEIAEIIRSQVAPRLRHGT